MKPSSRYILWIPPREHAARCDDYVQLRILNIQPREQTPTNNKYVL